MKKIILNFFILLGIVSCGFDDPSNKYTPASVGNPYEIFIFAPTELYRGALGDSLKTVLRKEVHMINFSEPSFDLFNLLPEGYKGLNAEHRNIIMMYLGDKYKTAKMFTVEDKQSKPQMITVLQAPDTVAMMELILKERYNIKKTIEKEEIKRFKNRANKVKDEKIGEKIKSMFGINLSVPKGYAIRKTIQPDYMWISLELPESSQGLVIYDYPYDGDTLSDSTILAMRNKFVANIPGELPTGYMTTGYMFTPEIDIEMINGRSWYVTRGFWRVENDFQGGPFVSFSTIDKVRNRVVVVDSYVYSPNPAKKQRNYLRQLEGIMNTASIN